MNYETFYEACKNGDLFLTFYEACKNGDLFLINQLVNDKNIDIGLGYACMYGQIHVIDLLVYKGGNFNKLLPVPKNYIDHKKMQILNYTKLHEMLINKVTRIYCTPNFVCR